MFWRVLARMSEAGSGAPQTLRSQILEKLSQLITAAFGFVAALAWNDAIRALLARYVVEGSGLRAQVGYALGVTVLAVLVAVWIGRASARAAALGRRWRARRTAYR